MRRAPALAAAAALVSAACAHPGPPGRDGPGSGLAEADAGWAAALAGGDETAFLARVAPDALFASGTLQSGRDEVWSGWRGYFAKGGPSLRWAPSAAGGAGSGDLGWTTGSFRFETKASAGEPSVAEGRYVTVWSRPAGGPWLASLDMGLAPSSESSGATRRELRTLTSRDGTLQASMGTWERQDAPGPRRGAWLVVRERAAQGWKVLFDTAVALPPPP